MNDGWIIEKDGALALWSGHEIQGLKGLPKINGVDLNRLSIGLGKTSLAVLTTGVNSDINSSADVESGVYSSDDGVDWRLLSIPPEHVNKDTHFSMDLHSGVVSYIQGQELHVVDRSGKRIIELPSPNLSCAAQTSSGDWVAVGQDLDEHSDSWNKKTTAWILREGAFGWCPFTPTVSPFQDFLIRNWFATDRLCGLDVWESPRLFIGDSGSWDEWSYDSLFVESASGIYRPFRTGAVVISGFGRDARGNPFYTTILGEYMKWDGKRFVESGWRTKLSRLFSDVPGNIGLTRMSVVGDKVRGVLSKQCSIIERRNYTFLSDDFGESWHGPEFDPGNEGWRIFEPFVRPS